MLFDDYVMRQVRQIAEAIAAISGAERGRVVDPAVDDALADAYRALLGLDVGLADTLSASSLGRMLHETATKRALVELITAHGDLLEKRGDPTGARLRWQKALDVLAEVDDANARAAIERRLTGLAP